MRPESLSPSANGFGRDDGHPAHSGSRSGRSRLARSPAASQRTKRWNVLRASSPELNTDAITGFLQQSHTMRKTTTSLLFLLALAVPCARGADSKPNIVFIMADDLGNADLGYRGGEITTPNIDRLAATGVRCESFYGMPVCTPSRAALMTGRYPIRHGLQTLVIFPSHGYGLPTDERTLPSSPEGCRLPDLHGGQVASRPCRPEVLAAEPRIWPFLRLPRGRTPPRHCSADPVGLRRRAHVARILGELAQGT